MSFPLDSVVGLFRDVVNKIWPDKTEVEKQAIAERMAQAAQETDLLKGQLEINQNEATSSNFFIAGWRPAIGWICGFIFGWTYLVQPILVFILTTMGHPVALPNLDLGETLPVLLGMLGLGAYRTYEKVQGIKK